MSFNRCIINIENSQMLFQIVGNMLRSIIISFALVALFSAYASSDMVKSQAQKYIEECRLEYNIEKDKIEESVKNQKLPETEDGKCFLECLLNKSGMIREDGKLNHFKIKTVLAMKLYDNPDRMKKVSEVINTCHKEVKKPEEKCGYAVALAKCAMKHIKEAGLPELDFNKILST